MTSSVEGSLIWFPESGTLIIFLGGGIPLSISILHELMGSDSYQGRSYNEMSEIAKLLKVVLQPQMN